MESSNCSTTDNSSTMVVIVLVAHLNVLAGCVGVTKIVASCGSNDINSNSTCRNNNGSSRSNYSCSSSDQN